MPESVGCRGTLTVRGPLVRWLRPEPGRTRCAHEINARLDEATAGLGLPGRAAVRLTLGPEGTADERIAVEDWIDLRVHGRRCRYSAELLAQLAGALEGRPADDPYRPLPKGWSALGTERAGERAATLVASVCAEAVKLVPSVLLGPALLARYTEEFGLAARSAPALAEILATLLDQGTSLADRPAIGRAVRPDGLPLNARATAESLKSLLRASHVDVLVPDDVAPLLGTGDVGDTDDVLGWVALSLFEEQGLLLPPFRIVPPDGLPAHCFAFRLNALSTAPYALLGPDEILVNADPDRLAGIGVVARPAVHPASGSPGALASKDAAAVLEQGGLSYWTRELHVALCLAHEARSRARWLVHQALVQAQLDVLEDVAPTVVGAARARIAPGTLTALLGALAADGISLRDLPPVLERIIDAAHVPSWSATDRLLLLDDPVTAARTERPPDFDDPAWLEGFVRTGLRRRIAARHAVNGDALTVCLLDAQIDTLVRRTAALDTTAATGADRAEDALRARDAAVDAIVAAVRRHLGLLPPQARMPVLLTDDDIRPTLRAMLRPVLPRVGVVGYGDLPPDLTVQAMARIELPTKGPP